MTGEPFRKRAPAGLPGALAFEAAGLAALAAAGARVPRVLEAGDEVLVLERVSAGGTADARQQEEFGRQLARVHRTTGERYGALDPTLPGYLGLCPVDLTPADSWAESWLDRRVRPLTRQAVAAGVLDPAAAALADRLGPEGLGPPEPPTLVHGDLWAGNRLVDASGDSWLIDPAAHWGHREVDLAMMRLFGGFTDREHAAYAEELPLAEGWRQRVPVYQLVPLLVHAILFDGGYGAQTMAALRAAR
ncbi:fructosamine kinase family protein [Ornithinicoccus halotolerans]|uniref:fructosamine kinase family protein n=1 Tax=Ornithinicoccus halotolerans TaxID=1748220 RepID=UPI001294E01B|nr:fructosamine kinase family protein [Ornithinicoccus halotolerans]